MALCFILSTDSGAGERRQRRKEQKGRERVLGLSAGGEGEDAQAEAGRAVWVFALWIRSHDSLLCPARLPGPGYSPLSPPPFSYLPPDALFHSSLTPFQTLPAFDLLYHLTPGAVEDLRMREKESKIKERLETLTGISSRRNGPLPSLFWI